jgi:ABC-type Fe3+-hydroxamate transport system substrate-binding protein
MEKIYTLTITTSGDGSEAKAEELIAKLVAQISEIRGSLGNLQADVTLIEQE